MSNKGLIYYIAFQLLFTLYSNNILLCQVFFSRKISFAIHVPFQIYVSHCVAFKTLGRSILTSSKRSSNLGGPLLLATMDIRSYLLILVYYFSLSCSFCFLSWSAHQKVIIYASVSSDLHWLSLQLKIDYSVFLQLIIFYSFFPFLACLYFSVV